ncbi:uncharacterized protein [Ptychodera flava]|uniref:uncharacterized protein n=1 Tax=Ptychodera flava TaxID=63121 RepID=UPI00396A9E85
MERKTLESDLKEAMTEKAAFKEIYERLTQKLESTEESLVSQRIENSENQKTLQSELEDKKKLIKELEDKLEKSVLKNKETKPLKRSNLNLRWKGEIYNLN